MRYSILSIFGALLLLSACDVTTPSQVKTGEIRLAERMKTVTLDPSAVDQRQVQIVADDYKRNGSGEVRAVVSFMQGPKNEIAAQAGGLRLKKAFEQAGIPALRVEYVPVDNRAYAGQAVVSYNATTALAPTDCGRIIGYQGTDTLDNLKDYRFGCETKDMMSQMVSRPEDLMGTAGAPQGDSRRLGTLIERYKSGTPNPKIDGINASTVGE